MEDTNPVSEAPAVPTMEQVLEQWAQIAEPTCKKCHGTGVYGWRVEKGERVPIPCMGKRCVVWRYRLYQLVQARQKLADEKARKEEADAKISEEA